MKKNYIIPRQRWAIMEENYLLGSSDSDADEGVGMESRSEQTFEGDGSNSNGSNIWNEW